jgi:hypothetical protein
VKGTIMTIAECLLDYVQSVDATGAITSELTRLDCEVCSLKAALAAARMQQSEAIAGRHKAELLAHAMQQQNDKNANDLERARARDAVSYAVRRRLEYLSHRATVTQGELETDLNLLGKLVSARVRTWPTVLAAPADPPFVTSLRPHCTPKLDTNLRFVDALVVCQQTGKALHSEKMQAMVERTGDMLDPIRLTFFDELDLSTVKVSLDLCVDDWQGITPDLHIPQPAVAPEAVSGHAEGT